MALELLSPNRGANSTSLSLNALVISAWPAAPIWSAVSAVGAWPVIFSPRATEMAESSWLCSISFVISSRFFSFGNALATWSS